MFSTSDTIAAIATPPGRGALGVVRLSGPAALRVASGILTCGEPLQPRHATLTYIRTPSAGTHGEGPGNRQEASRESSGRESSRVQTLGDRSPGTKQPGGGGPRIKIDQVVATYFPGPSSYTGDDVIEISAHGSPIVLHQIVGVAMAAGARLAEPGEFTLRAFLNGRLDLVQAEAIGDLVDAVTPLQARVAFDQLAGTLTQRIGEIDAALFDVAARFEASLDFPEEGYRFVEPGATASEIGAIEGRVGALLAGAGRGRLIREGAQVALAGKPNVGKSSLFNALVGVERAIVAARPGTTRDFITELTDMHGVRVTLIDTAGERVDDQPTDGNVAVDEVERDGLARAQRARQVADLVLLVLDRSIPLDAVDRRMLDETSAFRRLIVVNKTDLAPAWDPGAEEALIQADREGDSRSKVLAVSVRHDEGLDGLRAAIVTALVDDRIDSDWEDAAVTNLRHGELLTKARASLRRARESIEASGGTLSEEFVLADLQEARNALEEITGKRTSEDLLAHIFGRFCIGK